MQLNQSALRLFLRQMMFLHDRRDADRDFRVAKDSLELGVMHLGDAAYTFPGVCPMILWRNVKPPLLYARVAWKLSYSDRSQAMRILAAKREPLIELSVIA
jgi:hypothetical protein